MVHGDRAVRSLGGLPRLQHLIRLTSTLVHAFWLARRQQQAARSSSTRAAAAGGAQRVMAAAGAKGKALISVSDKTGLDALAKVGRQAQQAVVHHTRCRGGFWRLLTRVAAPSIHPRPACFAATHRWQPATCFRIAGPGGAGLRDCVHRRQRHRH